MDAIALSSAAGRCQARACALQERLESLAPGHDPIEAAKLLLQATEIAAGTAIILGQMMELQCRQSKAMKIGPLRAFLAAFRLRS